MAIETPASRIRDQAMWVRLAMIVVLFAYLAIRPLSKTMNSYDSHHRSLGHPQSELEHGYSRWPEVRGIKVVLEWRCRWRMLNPQFSGGAGIA